MIFSLRNGFRSVIAPALWGCFIGRTAGVNSGITAFWRAAGDDGFMGHPGWFWMFVIEGLLAAVLGYSHSFGLMTHRSRHVFE